MKTSRIKSIRVIFLGLTKMHAPMEDHSKNLPRKEVGYLSILIVLYNCSPEDSETVNSLLEAGVNFVNAELCLWNNGPISAKPQQRTVERFKEMGVSIRFVETIKNYPLSWIYNHFLKVFDSKSYVILDHDSKLSKEYVIYLRDSSSDFISVPLIKAKGAPRSPLVNGKFSFGPYNKFDHLIAVGSGVILSAEAAREIAFRFGDVFDERFALYGVDTSFFIRVNKLGLSEKVKIVPGFEHSFSRLEEEPATIKAFRELERGYDLGLQLRLYPDGRRLGSFFKQIIFSFIGKNNLSVVSAFIGFFRGRHYKCQGQAKINFEMENKDIALDE